MCLFLNCRYLFIIVENVKDLLQKLDAFSLNHKHVDCLYTFLKYRFTGKFLVKSEQLFDNVEGSSFQLTKQKSGQKAKQCKNKFLKEKYKIRLLSSLQKTKLMQTSK